MSVNRLEENDVEFSVITVCLNCNSVISATIESVLSQEYKNYEYIIIDGNSTDGTYEIIRDYKKNSNMIRSISEPDNGIYDAMNKGITISRGKYLFFLNAGDKFYNKSVLGKVHNEILDSRGDILYGDVVRNSRIYIQAVRWSVFRMVYLEKMICHQSIFADRTLFNDCFFDTTIGICADRDWLIKCLHRGARVRYMTNLVVSFYDSSGISSNYQCFQKDSLRIAKKYGGRKAVLFIKLKRLIGRLVGKSYCDNGDNI